MLSGGREPRNVFVVARRLDDFAESQKAQRDDSARQRGPERDDQPGQRRDDRAEDHRLKGGNPARSKIDGKRQAE